MDPTSLAIIATIVLATIGIVVFFIVNKKPTKRYSVNNKTILITGDMNSGKTALFYRLKTGKFVETVTSLQQNAGTFPVAAFAASNPKSREWSYYDLPGHGSFTSQLPHIIPATKAIVFMIDSTSISSISTAAQALYNLLTNKYLSDRSVPLYLTVNKTDLSTTLPIPQIKQLLAAEVNQIYKANRGAKELGAIGGGDESDNVMTKIELLQEDGTFSFDKPDELNYSNIQWVSISVKDNELEELVDALAKAQ